MDLFLETFDVAEPGRRGRVDDPAAGGQERQHARGPMRAPDLGTMHADLTKVRQACSTC